MGAIDGGGQRGGGDSAAVLDVGARGEDGNETALLGPRVKITYLCRPAVRHKLMSDGCEKSRRRYTIISDGHLVTVGYKKAVGDMCFYCSARYLLAS